MLPFFCEQYGNPSGIYEFSTFCKSAVNEARKRIAELIHCERSELIFTSGGTESDNWAVQSAARLQKSIGRGNHIITTNFEHPAVLNTCKSLQKEGFEVTFLPVDEFGFISTNQLERAIRSSTCLVSIMMANNEIGTIEPIKELCSVAKQHDILFHTDAVQAVGQIPIDVADMGIDLLSASAHKLYGPKGIGFLYIKNGLKLPPLFLGGRQERNLRPGTENVPAIVGFKKAAELAVATMQDRASKETELRDYLIGRVLAEIPYTKLNGPATERLPGNANFSFRFVEGESLLIMLDVFGICASSGSACSTGSEETSHVLRAIGLSDEDAKGSLRLTLGADTTKEEIDITIERMKEIISKIRKMSPAFCADNGIVNKVQ